MFGTRLAVWICLPFAVLTLLACLPVPIFYLVMAFQGRLGEPGPVWGFTLLVASLIFLACSATWLTGAWFILRDRQSSWIAHVVLVVTAVPAVLLLLGQL